MNTGNLSTPLSRRNRDSVARLYLDATETAQRACYCVVLLSLPFIIITKRMHFNVALRAVSVCVLRVHFNVALRAVCVCPLRASSSERPIYEDRLRTMSASFTRLS